MQQYDLIIIGSGPGGYHTAAEACAMGMKVAVAEQDQLGGTCLNRGCIPTKTLAAAAGRAACERGTYAAAHARITAVVQQLRDDIATMLEGADVIKGIAAITPEGNVRVGDDIFAAPKIIIATGSAPAPLRGLEGAQHTISSDDFLRSDTLPERLTIVGGGVIGLEFASVADAFGCKVTIVEFCKEIAPALDSEISRRLRRALAARGIDIITEAAATSVSADHTLHYTRKGKDAELPGDAVLVAVGRRAVIPEGCKDAGIEVNERGFIVTDNNYATTRAGIWAVGDVNGRCMLAHAAAAQGMAVLRGVCCGRAIPSVVFTEPQCASVSLALPDTKSVKVPYAANGYALASDISGLFKLEYAPDGHIAGCHAIGPHAADLTACISVAIAGNMTVSDLQTIVFAHPTLSEIIQQAASQARL